MAFGKKHSIIAIVGIAVLSAGGWWYQKQSSPGMSKAPAATGAATASGASGAPGAPRAVSVEVGSVEVMALQDDAQAVGTLRSKQNVMMRPEVAGRVVALGFADGGRVKAGQVLVQLDDSLQRAEVKQSLAQVSIARANLKRNQELVAQNFVAQRVLDEGAANLEVVQAQLALSCARLGRMAVVAPFDGVVGLRLVNKGDYVKDGADLVGLEDISSMLVDYRLPERLAGKLKTGQTVALQLDAFAGRQFKARIEAIEPVLDVNGRSVGVRAVLPNTAGEPLAPAGKPGPAGAGGGDKKGGAMATPAKAPPAKAARPAPGAADAGQVVALPALNETLAQAGCPPKDDGAGSQRSGARPAAAAGKTAAPAGAAKPAGPTPLRPGMFARVNTVFAVREKALAIPEEAVVPQGARQFVIRVVKASELPPQTPATPASGASAAAGASAAPAPVLAPDALVSMRQEVKLGIRKAGKVEVLEGLQEGQTIVLAGQQRLQRDGTPVKVVELGRPPAGAASAAQASSSAPVAPASPAVAASR